MQSILNLKVGQSAKIFKIQGSEKIKNRLLELGFVKNAVVEILAVSSLKKTFLLKVQNGVLAIRHDTLKDVLICKK